ADGEPAVGVRVRADELPEGAPADLDAVLSAVARPGGRGTDADGGEAVVLHEVRQSTEGHDLPGAHVEQEARVLGAVRRALDLDAAARGRHHEAGTTEDALLAVLLAVATSAELHLEPVEVRVREP